MTTTIKVDRELRDVLKKQAQAHGRTLGQHLAALAEAEVRRGRLAAMGAAMQETPPDDAYLADAQA
ncbi:MAG: hypothetical protein L0K01_00395 [Brachybacterium sp.]|nr:hypothetical protein [Brachybacterium sp.]